jgi:hypothetical protein
MCLCEDVSKRLLGPWHLPAVQEALGCLIPASLDARHDGKRPRGKTHAMPSSMGAVLHAGSWKVDVNDEQALTESRLSKGMAEFFLIALRRVCSRLRLGIALGSHHLGLHLHSQRSVAELNMTVQLWKSWHWLVEDIRKASVFIVLVALDDSKFSRDCVLLIVASRDPSLQLRAAAQVSQCSIPWVASSWRIS